MKLARTVTLKVLPAVFLTCAVFSHRDVGAQETAAPSALDAAMTRESEATVKAFNAADAAALGGMFLETGELVDEAGTVHAGKAAITDLFVRFFERFPQAMLEMQLASVRPVGDTLAVEEGRWDATDEGWVVKSEATMPDGTTGSATLVITVEDADHFVVRASDRIVGGAAEPDFELKITRRPPQPGAAK